MMRQACCALLLCIAAVSCGPSHSVDLSASMKSPSLQFQQGALGGALGGQFTLQLHLGGYAPEAVTVENAPSFKLLDANGVPAIDPLGAVAAPGSFPLELQPDDARSVTFTVMSSQLLSTSQTEKACAGPVTVSGVVNDSEQRSVAFESNSVTLGGCP